MSKRPEPKVPAHLADPFVPAPEARQFLGGIDLHTQRDWVAAGILPKPLRITARTQGWRLSTLERVLERAAESAGA